MKPRIKKRKIVLKALLKSLHITSWMVVVFVIFVIITSVVVRRVIINNSNPLGHFKKQALFLSEDKLIALTRFHIYTYDIRNRLVSAPLYYAHKKGEIILSATPIINDERNILIFYERNLQEFNKVYLCYLDLRSYELHKTLIENAPIDANFLSDNKTLFLNFGNNNVWFFNPQIKKEYSLYFDKFRAVALDENRLFILSKKKQLWYDLAKKEILLSQNINIKNEKSVFIDITADRKHMLTFHSRNLNVSNLVDDQPNKNFMSLDLDKDKTKVTLRDDGKLAAIYTKNKVLMLDTDTMETLWQIPFAGGLLGPNSLEFSKEGNLLLVGGSVSGQIGSIFMYKVKNGKFHSRALGAND